MAPLDTLFAKRDADPYHHPLLRFLDAPAPKPDKVRVEMVRPRDVLGYKAATIYVHWAAGGVDQPPQPYPWDGELNAELVRRNVRSVSPEAEAVRFGLALRDAFKRPEARFGDGFFNAVLVEVVRELGFPAFEEVDAVLKHIATHAPHKGGNGFADCREIIVGIISTRAAELVDLLGYSQGDAKNVLAAAMAQYLDDRFSVSNRIRLGWENI